MGMYRIVFLLSFCGFVPAHPRNQAMGSDADSNQVEHLHAFRNTPALDGTLKLGNSPYWQNEGYRCQPNGQWYPQYCLCKPGQKVSSLDFTYNNRDRHFTLECTDVKPEFKVPDVREWWQEHTFAKGDVIDFSVSGNGQNASFLVGMTSIYPPDSDDRRYKFFTVQNGDWYCSDCSDWIQINTFNGHLRYYLGDDEVITGVISQYDANIHDRKWKIQVCKLKRKCTEVYKIDYGRKNVDVTSKVLFAGSGGFNNKLGLLDNEYAATITSSRSTSLSDSHEFSQTGGTTTMASMAISEGITLDIPFVGSATFDISAGFSESFEFSNTWTRSHTKSYSKSNGRQMTFKGNCKVGCVCSMDVLVQRVNAVIPYTLKSRSPDWYFTCEETGDLKVNYSFNAKANVTDKCIN